MIFESSKSDGVNKVISEYTYTTKKVPVRNNIVYYQIGNIEKKNNVVVKPKKKKYCNVCNLILLALILN